MARIMIFCADDVVRDLAVDVIVVMTGVFGVSEHSFEVDDPSDGILILVLSGEVSMASPAADLALVALSLLL